MQVLASFLINILALATGASYGIANVLLSKQDDSDPVERSVMVFTNHTLEPKVPFIYAIDTNEAS